MGQIIYREYTVFQGLNINCSLASTSCTPVGSVDRCPTLREHVACSEECTLAYVHSLTSAAKITGTLVLVDFSEQRRLPCPI